MSNTSHHEESVGGVSTQCLNYAFYLRAGKERGEISGFNTHFFFWLVLFIYYFFLGKVREDQDRERAEPVFLFSHSVLLKGCLTEREQVLKKKRVRLKAVCSLAKASKPFLPTPCPFEFS